MANVQLMVTGNLESLALHKALGRVKVFSQANIQFLAPKKYNSFTSSDPKPKRDIDELAAALVAEIHVSQPPDMVIVIDDLELANLHQPEVVASRFHEAVEWYVQNYDWATEKTKQSRYTHRGHRVTQSYTEFFYW
jgi:hypothetical protein